MGREVSYQHLVGTMPTPAIIFLCNENLDIVCSNAALWALFGCADEAEFMAFCGGSYRALVAAEHEEHVSRMVGDARVPGRQHQKRYHIVTKQGGEKKIEDVGASLAAESGELLLFNQLIEQKSAAWQKTVLDDLTGIHNKEGFLDKANHILEEAERQGETARYSFVYFNIKNFKYYNMRYGRQTGDSLLQYVAKALKQIEKDILVSRYGDDHFISICRDVDILESIGNWSRSFDKEFESFGLKIKAGIYRARAEVSTELSVDLAKIACDSISNTSQTVRVYDTVLEEQIQRDNYVERNLDRAMEQGYIQVYYQPVIRTINRSICGAEALCRWNDPEMGFLSPDDFIPVLEQKRLIKKLDLYVVEQVCQDIGVTIARREQLLPISVNLSKLDFQDEDIVQKLDRIVLSHGIPRDMLYIEITESAVMVDPERLKMVISEFQALGYQVWMDDFGSELSSLNLLSSFSFDEIKLDMLFLRAFDARSKEMLRSIVQMAKRLGIHTLTEGVESEEQFRYLQEIGCDKVQGFYFSKPLSFHDLEKYKAHSGLPIEPRKMHRYHDAISDVDFITDRPMAVVEFDGKKFTFLYRSREFDRVHDQIGGGDPVFTEYLMNSPASTLARKFRELQRDTERNQGVRKMNFPLFGKYFSIASRQIACNDGLSANQIELQTITMEEPKEESDKLDYIFRTMYSTYDDVYLLTAESDFINVMQGASGQLESQEKEEQAPFSREEIKENTIFWRDQKEFMEFTDPITLRPRLQQEERGYEVRYFRSITEKNGYVWKAHTIQYIPDMDMLIYSTRPAFFYQNAFLDRLLPAYQLEKKEGVEGLIWKRLLYSDSLNLFWKDTDRRFLGVNQRFLKTYGFDSEEEILGKTDEEMNWHVENIGFFDDEKAVLEKGEVIRNHIGKCIIQGIPHTIMATKEPLYEDGRIIGLIGFFVDLDSLGQVYEGDLSRQIDADSGFLTAQGVGSVLTDYLNAWKLRREKFAVIQLTFRDLEQLYHNYGKDVIRDMKRELRSMLLQLCGGKSTIGRLYTGTFSILRKYQDREEVLTLVHDIEERMKNTRLLAGFPVELTAAIEVRYAEKRADEKKLFALATGGVLTELKSFQEQLEARGEMEKEKKQQIVTEYGAYLEYIDSLQGTENGRTAEDDRLLHLMNFQKHMFFGLSKLYFSMHVINLKEMTFMKIACVDFIHEVLKDCKDAQEALNQTTKYLIQEEHQDSMLAFVDTRTLQERLRGKPILTLDFNGNHTGWCRSSFVPISYNPDGTVQEVLYSVHQVQGEKEKEAEIKSNLELSLQDIWSTYENLGDLIYAADMDTNELLYMNRKAREVVGVLSNEEIQGRKCYDVIQGKEVPCEFCSNARIADGKPCEYDFYNEKYRMFMRIRDQRIVHGGRNIRIESVSDAKLGAQGLPHEDSAYLRQLLNEGIRLALEEKDTDRGLQLLIDHMGSMLQAERSYIFETIEDGKAWTNRYEWCAEGVTPEKERLSYVPKEATVLWNREFEKGNYIWIPDVEKIKESDRMSYDYLTPQNIQSLLAVPLNVEGELYGFLGLDNPSEKSLGVIKELALQIAHVAETLIERRIMQKKMDDMIYLDALTGLGNRYAVERSLKKIRRTESLGLAFCDVCSLKHVNDTCGHLKGDQLLERAKTLLTDIFPKEQVFRWGGDEFLILVSGMEKKQFREHCEQLKKQSLALSVPIAVGGVWSEHGAVDFDEQVKAADELMYSHKKLLYQMYDIHQIVERI